LVLLSGWRNIHTRQIEGNDHGFRSIPEATAIVRYNPIERRFFPHVNRACKGIIFKDFEIVKKIWKKRQRKWYIF
jgi:hypothetical protein